MFGGNRFNGARAQDHRHADRNRLVAHERCLRIGNLREIGPDRPIEHMAFERGNHRLGRINSQRCFTLPCHAINHDRQTGNMIQVGMRNKHMINSDQLR